MDIKAFQLQGEYTVLYLRHKNVKHTKLTHIHHQQITHTHQMGLASKTHTPLGNCWDVSTLFKVYKSPMSVCVRVLRRSWGWVNKGRQQHHTPTHTAPIPHHYCPKVSKRGKSAVPSSPAFHRLLHLFCGHQPPPTVPR